MKKLIIKSLVIVSEKTKTANKFEFKPGKNLITSDNNTVGKSTLVKMILWSFGCKPRFDTNWKALEAKAAITFTVDRTEYTIIRDGSQIQIRRGHEKFEKFTKISGAYSEKIANLLSFKPNFKLKSSDDYSIATPDGYFMAYYLDQECWTKAWSSLDGLLHFDKAVPDLVKTHSGLLTSDYFECQIEELNTIDKKKEIETINEQYNNALDIVRRECAVPSSTITIDSDLLVLQNTEITKNLSDLQEQQSNLWSKLAKLYTRKNHLQNQILIEEANIVSLSEDYSFAYTLDHIIHCPVCNSAVDNDVVQKAGLIADKESCEQILDAHKRELTKISDEILNLQGLYEDVSQKVDSINTKYIVETTDSSYTGAEALTYFAEKAIQDKLTVATSKQQLAIEQKNLEIKRLKKEQKDIKKRVDKESINSFFCHTLRECQKALGLDFSSIQEKVKSPTDYTKILQGGAADKTRSILSYYVALYLLIRNQNNEVVGPLFIDTPFQQEQSDSNETRIISLIEDKLVDTRSCNQLFLCAKKDEGVDIYKQNANIIELNDTRALLSAALYSDCLETFALLQK